MSHSVPQLLYLAGMKGHGKIEADYCCLTVSKIGSREGAL